MLVAIFSVATPSAAQAQGTYQLGAYYWQKGDVTSSAKDFTFNSTVQTTSTGDINVFVLRGTWGAADCNGTLGGPGHILIHIWTADGKYDRQWEAECSASNKKVEDVGRYTPGTKIYARLGHWGGVVPFTTWAGTTGDATLY
ncbi:hypothetical protein SAMN05216215_108727 [Saccharopolyspora shandongensis]|uniref:Uncharacterized protein n=1 Tax=Saccharopolyspora shandongensis TaxID=418495 RepID=A0A1H3TP16_9PSEU|nr:hypothetical protein [Saccharopolyspora shandongensis]SDZ51385.1 hypothetical protein SAMN05216215_108727 [Saccharopolyspora shandongensis]